MGERKKNKGEWEKGEKKMRETSARIKIFLAYLTVS